MPNEKSTRDECVGWGGMNWVPKHGRQLRYRKLRIWLTDLNEMVNWPGWYGMVWMDGSAFKMRTRSDNPWWIPGNLGDWVGKVTSLYQYVGSNECMSQPEFTERAFCVWPEVFTAHLLWVEDDVWVSEWMNGMNGMNWNENSKVFGVMFVEVKWNENSEVHIKVTHTTNFQS